MQSSKQRVTSFLFAAIASCACLPLAHAQVESVGSTLIVPVVVSSGTYQSDIYVRNQASTSHTVNITFYEAVTSSQPGTKVCTPLVMNPFIEMRFDLAAQCSLAAGSHHGFMTLSSATAFKDKLLTAYARTFNFQGIGFAVEAYPIGLIGGGSNYAEVLGLKRTAASGNTPAYQTNCFVAALDDPVDYRINIYNNSGSGSTQITGTLLPFEMRRHLDVLAAVGTGQVDHAVAFFEKTNAAQFANTLISFCTVQDNTSFGADFRIAKTWDGGDPGRQRQVCLGTLYDGPAGNCSANLVASPIQLFNATLKDRFVTMVHAPDILRCVLVGPRAADLEMQLVRSFQAVVAGGNGQTAFTYTTGPRSAIGNGFHQSYFLEVSFREGGDNTTPIPYGVNCTAGNGMMFPLYATSLADDF